jgi:hypothetical protein
MQVQELAQSLRETGVRIEVGQPGFDQAGDPSAQDASETCVNALLNPEFDVVEFGDGTGSIEHWSILYQKVCYSTQNYWSDHHSVAISDGSCSVNPDETNRYNDHYGRYMEYDSFAQGFWTPGNLTFIHFSYMAASTDLDDGDWAVSALYTLDNEGYLDEYLIGFYVTESEGVWGNGWWQVTEAFNQDVLDAASGRPMALVFFLWGNDSAPKEWLWLDDAQLQLCYERGSDVVYLPLAAKQQGTSPGPTCVPREPDSVDQMGKTAVGATCTGSLGSVDQKDYYALTLNGANALKLRLFDMPDGTNWDAHIFEDDPGAGYPLVCYTGSNSDPFDDPKSVNCNVNPSKDYFVMMNRGPETISGQYKVSVTRR